MSELPLIPTTPPEVSLLLRAHAEQSWLHREVLPVVRQVESSEAQAGERAQAHTSEGLQAGEGARTSEALEELSDGPAGHLPQEQVPAALAYLEVVWAEAARRAGNTDGASTHLEMALPTVDPDLGAKARRYRAAVVVLRASLARRVRALLVSDLDGGGTPARHPSPLGWAGA